jgi:hypothetical protein
MCTAQDNTGLTAINIQDRHNVILGLGQHFPSSWELENQFSVPSNNTNPWSSSATGIYPMFSGVMVQEALEGNAASTIHLDVRGVDLTPTLPKCSPPRITDAPGFSDADFHSSSEARQVVVYLQSTDPGARKVDIVLQHEDGVTIIPRNSNTAQGAPLPSRLANSLPNILPPTPSRLQSVGAAGADVVRATVPGAFEAETALISGSHLANASGYIRLGSGLATGARFVPVAGGSLIVGTVVGNVAENTASELGAGPKTAKAVGFFGAVGSGAGTGALLGAPFEGVGAIPGAVIGGIAGGAGWIINKIF